MRVEVRSGPFSVDIEAEARSISHFLAALRALHKSLSGEARLEFWNEAHSVILKGNGLGGIEVIIKVTDVRLAISVVLLTQAYPAEEQKPRVPGIYSDLAFKSDAGDLLGTEMFIIPIGFGEYAVFFQCWGGESTQPVTVPVKVNGDAISFTVRSPSCGVGAYKGHISKNTFRNVSTTLRRLSVEFKLGFLEFTSPCDGLGSFLTKHSGVKAMTLDSKSLPEKPVKRIVTNRMSESGHSATKKHVRWAAAFIESSHSSPFEPCCDIGNPRCRPVPIHPRPQ
jgi:hypothetical protein